MAMKNENSEESWFYPMAIFVILVIYTIAKIIIDTVKKG
jgi:uncharacterized membrane protein YdbT with pleckstrin-like domain